MNKRDLIPFVKLIIRATISLIILIASLIVMFGNYPHEYSWAAFGFVGVIIGYWLK